MKTLNYGSCDIEALEVSILVRDINGNKYNYAFKNFGEAAADINELIREDDEIQVITVNNQIIWTALTGEPLNIDDLTGFFG